MDNETTIRTPISREMQELRVRLAQTRHQTAQARLQLAQARGDAQMRQHAQIAIDCCLVNEAAVAVAIEELRLKELSASTTADVILQLSPTPVASPPGTDIVVPKLADFADQTQQTV